MFFDTLLPPQETIRITPTFDVRERFERRVDRDFSKLTPDDRTNLFSRLRIGATAIYGKEWSFGLQYQYAHDWIFKSSSKATDEGSDLSLGYAKYKTKTGDLTVGRQKMNLGTERLVGTAEWVNVPRSMDGFRFQSRDWDAFAFKIGVGQPKPTDTRVFGLAKTGPWGQTSYLYKHDKVAAKDVDISTVSHWMTHKFGDWTLDAEAAFQFGRNQGRDQRAWAWHSVAWHPLGSKTKGFVEFNAASGGGNATSSFTFDNLYPTNHKFYGNMDLQSWRNMGEVALGAVHKLDNKTDLSASWHSFTLRDPSDAWYGAGGAPNKGANGDFVDPTGKSGRDVGWEIDLDASFKANKDLTVSGGIGLFQPGKFVKSLNGGHGDRQTWLFAQAVIRF